MTRGEIMMEDNHDGDDTHIQTELWNDDDDDVDDDDNDHDDDEHNEVNQYKRQLWHTAWDLYNIEIITFPNLSDFCRFIKDYSIMLCQLTWTLLLVQFPCDWICHSMSETETGSAL